MALSFQLSMIAPTDDVWSVTQLVSATKRLVEGGFMPLWIRGEVVGCKAWSSGHWYFGLRDRQTQVRCCMWSRYNQGLGERRVEVARCGGDLRRASGREGDCDERADEGQSPSHETTV